MKQGTFVRSALVAVFTLVIAPSTMAAGMDASSSGMAQSPATVSKPACTDASGKPVTDVSVCASGACKDSSGKPVTNPSVCASASNSAGKPSSASWDLKSAK